jgi:DNA polymerase III epsilon subunit-like protein
VTPAFGAAWTAAFGPLPDDYVTIDTEATGFVPDRDYLTQFGWCRVVNRKAVSTGSVVVDWTRVMSPYELELMRDRMAGTAREMARKGQPYRWTVDRLRDTGVAPADAAAIIAGVFGLGLTAVGYNVWRFDRPLLGAFLAGHGGFSVIHPGRVIDAGAIVRASQTAARPRPGDSYFDFAKQSHATGRVKWAISGYCIPRFKLVDRFGVDPTAAHDADYDAWVTHLVFEECRAYIQTGAFACDLPASMSGVSGAAPSPSSTPARTGGWCPPSPPTCPF